MRTKITVLLFTLFITFPFILAAQWNYKTYLTSSQNLNVRSKPTTNSEILTVISPKDTMEVIVDLENGWTKIKLKDGSGYVASQYVTTFKMDSIVADDLNFWDKIMYNSNYIIWLLILLITLFLIYILSRKEKKPKEETKEILMGQKEITFDEIFKNTIEKSVTKAQLNVEKSIANSKSKKKVDKSSESYDEILSQLENLIGLTSVKEEVYSIRNYIEIQKSRKDKGLKTSPLNLHCVFTGNPGTGKTTVARLLSKLYKHLGVLETGHLIEVDRTGLIGQYLGQTGPKVDAKVEEAIGGTLFIDEAYSLVSSSTGAKDSYGSEAISVLLKRMEDHRDELAVIVAGYPNEMETFINSNPGLESRFTRFINFPDYNPAELVEIVKLFCKKEQYKLSKEAVSNLNELFTKLNEAGETSSGNGRLARNVFKESTEKQSSRLQNLSKRSRTREVLIEIKAEDIPSFSEMVVDF